MEKKNYLDKAIELDHKIEATADFLIQRCISQVKIAFASCFKQEETTHEQLEERKEDFDENLRAISEGQLKVIAVAIHEHVHNLNK